MRKYIGGDFLCSDNGICKIRENQFVVIILKFDFYSVNQ